jgi:MFS family permease
MVSWAIYRYGVATPADDAPRAHTQRYGWRQYLKLLTSSHVLLLAPTWIAVNASLGLWFGGQSLFQLVSTPDPRFSDQLLMGGFAPWQVSVGLGIGLLIFFGGLIYWGNRFKRYRRTTIILYGILGGALTVAAGVVLNHSAGGGPVVQLAAAVALIAGVFVLAGATPAALGLLADISEAYPRDRGAIMGLYSVFLAIGQIIGALIGGESATLRGIDGLFVATLILLAVALLPLFHLRIFEHRFVEGPGGPQPRPEQLGVPPD